MPIPDAHSAPSAFPTPPQDTPENAVHPEEELQPVAGLLAVLLPGLGHIYLGETRRGLLIAAGVLGLFFGGMLIGGIDVIDRQEDTIWFAGQALVGPIAFGIDYYHQNHLKVIGPTKEPDGRIVQKLRTANPGFTRGPGRQEIPAPPGVKPPNSKSIGRMNELGTLFATLAGMLNLIAIIDALLHARRERDPAILHARRLMEAGR
jgi:TM2 domain-containing membrane protein YozV